jgi:hypothetical protein
MRRLLLLVIAAALAVSIPASAQGPAGTLEYQVKAAFLYNFAKFIQWPSEAFTETTSPFTICVLGQDPFGAVLDEAVRGERIERRPLAIWRAEDPAATAGCHILFVSRSEEGRYRELLALVNTRRVLTVSEAPRFIDDGGHVSFFREGNRIRFTLNADALEHSELQVSSKLMQVADVRRGVRPSGSR